MNTDEYQDKMTALEYALRRRQTALNENGDDDVRPIGDVLDDADQIYEWMKVAKDTPQ